MARKATFSVHGGPAHQQNSMAIPIFLTLLAILSIAIAILYLYLLNYVYKLERIGCECSDDWRRNFIKYYIIAIFVLVVASFFMGPIIIFIAPITFVANIVCIVVIYQYVKKLKLEKCACADGTERKVLEYFNYAQMIMLAIGVLNLIVKMISIKVAYSRSAP